MEDELKEKQLFYELKLPFSNYSSIYELSKKIKGKCFTSSLKKVKHFEL